MERDINWYCQRAKENGVYRSYRKLGGALGITEGSISQFRTGRAFPSDDTMVKLAKLAGVDPYVALLDLSTWRTKGEAQKAYAKILQKITAAIALAFGLNALTSSTALAFSATIVTYSGPVSLPIVSSLLCAYVYYGKSENNQNYKVLILIVYLPSNVKLSNT